MQTRALVLDEDKIKRIMQEAGIPGVSIAFISGSEIQTKGISLQDNEQANNVVRDAVFGAASLSKPVFAYLVLALIKSDHYHFNLDSKLVDLLPIDQFSKMTGYQWNEYNPNWMENITVKMLLSHTSGLHFSDDNKIEFLFEPGTEYAYSNPGLFYLQKAIEAHTKQPLEQLARTYVFDQIGMSEKSTFYQAYELKEMPDTLQDCAPGILYIKETETGLQYKVKGLDGEDKSNMIPWKALPDDFPRNTAAIIPHKDKYLKLLLRHTAHAGHTSQPEAIAVFSLFTTANDYALFLKAWMELKKAHDPLMALAFEPDISMNKDKWAHDFDIPEIHLSHLASGLTWELETNDFGVPIRAYKTGDMDLWRAWAAIDFAEGNESAIIYFSNSENGHLLANQIVFPNVPLEHAPSFFFKKWGFAKERESDWKVKERERIQEIIAYEHGYKLDVMPEDISKLAHGVIYLKATVTGLSYTVFVSTGELVTSAISWNQLPEDFSKDISAIIENSKQYLPIILTHTQQEGHTRQPRSAVIKKDFYEMLKMSSVKEPLVKTFLDDYLSHHDKLPFETILTEYEKYFAELTEPEDKRKLSNIFWEQVKYFGTPIIEDDLQNAGKCNVYFLFPKDKIEDSKENEGTKKDLYLQGDFHGYGSTKEDKQRLLELSDTGIMWHKDSIPKDALVTYGFIQVEPSYRDIKPEPERSPFFVDGEGFSPHSANAKFPEIISSVYWDEYSTHLSPYPGFPHPERLFCVSADSKHAHVPGKRIDWPGLLSTETVSNKKNFVYHATLYSDNAGDLHRSDAPVTDQYHDDLYYANSYNLFLKRVPTFNELNTKELGEKPYLIKDDAGNYKIWGYKENTWQLTDIELTDTDKLTIPSEWKPNQTLPVSTTDTIFNTLKQGHTAYLPYADFTRDIQVFKPASGKIDNVIVINDGILYLIAGVMDHFEKMVSENKLSPNTAFVFIHPLPGLTATLLQEKVEDFNKDPSVKLPGMGVRLVDYKHGIDQYIDFIDNKLFPRLKTEIGIPDDPSHRVMIGSSMSGTASLYIGLRSPDLFGAVIVQSPSPDNRAKLSDIPTEMLTERKTSIHVSCGEFEHPDYAAANDNIGFATELTHKLGIPLHVGAHGHTCVPWAEELERSLPAAINMLKINSSMQAAYIPGMSIATISEGEIQADVLGCVDTQSKSRVNLETQFWACSLSKPVFAYLVLKMTKDGSLPENFLDEPLPWDVNQFGPQDGRKPFTPRMILSHQTGLPNESPVNFKFNPGEGFRYSGEGYLYLQKIIEEEVSKKEEKKMTLEQLAQAKLFEPLKMTRTSFLFPEEGDKATTHDEAMVPNPIPKQPANNSNAAGSLHTTASDYARFLMACMDDKDFIDLITPQIGYHLCLMSESKPGQGEIQIKCSSEGLEYKAFGQEDIHTIPWHDLPKEFPRQFASLNQVYKFLPHILEITLRNGHTPSVNAMEKDTDAKEKGLDSETLQPIDWGLGFGLQKDKSGNIVSAFHWGHGPGARTFFAINLEHPQSAVVYLTNSENGLAVAKDIAIPIVGDITPLMKFLSDKYGYEDIHAPNWKEYHECLIAGVSAENEDNFDLAIKSYKEAAKIWQTNLANKWFDRVLTSNKEPTLESIQPNTLVMLLEDQMLTVYWLENGKINNVSFPENSVPEITKFLPLVNESSNDKKLIEAIISQYGCTPKKNTELSHRIVIAEEKNKQDNVDVKVFKKLAGEYGPLTISVVNESKLQIHDGGPNSPRDLKWINNDTFLDVNGGNVLLKFKCNENRNPISLSCYFPSGANFLFPASKSNKSELSISSKSFFSQPQKQQADVENKKHRDKKMAKDDTALQSAKEKRASQEFTSKTEKKRVTSTDDFNITYGKRPSK